MDLSSLPWAEVGRRLRQHWGSAALCAVATGGPFVDGFVRELAADWPVAVVVAEATFHRPWRRLAVAAVWRRQAHHP